MNPSRYLSKTVSLPTTLSDTGPLKAAVTFLSLLLPNWTYKSVEATSEGSLVTIFITPPDAFFPKRVPCGPRRISILSISTRFVKKLYVLPKTTPSKTAETVGSTPDWNSEVPIPLM